MYFNPLPPHGGRQAWDRLRSGGGTFQSTPSAWRETIRRETSATSTWDLIIAFQSTPSAWRETYTSFLTFILYHISIHSLRMEGDVLGVTIHNTDRIISIHSLRMEGDQSALRQGQKCSHFNPLPPHGGRHGSSTVARQVHSISIHSLRMEGDMLRLL